MAEFALSGEQFEQALVQFATAKIANFTAPPPVYDRDLFGWTPLTGDRLNDPLGYFDELEDDIWDVIENASGAIVLPGFGSVEQVESFGGEGKGDQYWIVVKYTREDGQTFFYRKDGYYSSYSEGEYCGDCTLVTSREYVATKWVSI